MNERVATDGKNTGVCTKETACCRFANSFEFFSTQTDTIL